MPAELKLFIDGVEVKKGVDLQACGRTIAFDHISDKGKIVDSMGYEWLVSDCTIPKKTKKYAPAIFVHIDKNSGEVAEISISEDLYSKKPVSYNVYSNYQVEIYWPAQDYMNDYGFFILPER